MNALTASLTHHLGRQDRVEAFVSALPDFFAMGDEQRASVIAGLEQQQQQAPGAEPGVQSTQDNDRLKVLIDGDSQRMVTRLYQDFVSEENFVLFIEFVKGLDRYILKFRDLAKSREIGQQVPQQQQEGNGGGRGRGGKRRGGGGGGKVGPVDAPADDEGSMDAPPAANPEELSKPDAPSATIAALSRFARRAA